MGLIVVSALIIGFVARWLLRDFASDDWTTFLKFWQRFLIEFGGFPALRYAFSNYAAPYTYLLAIVTQTLGTLPPMHQVKLVSVLFDVACAVMAYRLVAFYKPGTMWPALAFVLVFLAPTVVLNSAAWGQADSIFTTFLLASLWALGHKRYSLAMVLYAISVSFKLQAVFVLPLFVFLAAERSMPWRTFVVLPAVYALINVPALLMGRPLADALFVYGAQVDRYDDLTLKAPNLFQWLPPDPRALLQWMGFALAGAFVIAVWFISRRTNQPIANSPLPVALALLIGLPFFLPRMHDRYFYPADVVSIVFVLAMGRAWWIALAVNAASLSAYVAYLWERDANFPQVPLWLAAALMFVALVGVMGFLVRHARADGHPENVDCGVLGWNQSTSWRKYWIPAFAGMTTLVVAIATIIGTSVREANDRVMMAATFEHNGYIVRLHRPLATQCEATLNVGLSWIGSTLRRAPRAETYSVFVHVYNAAGQRIAVADGYVDGAFPLNDVEFDLTETRMVTLDPSNQAASVRVGIYTVETVQRFRATRPDGVAWDGDEVVIPVTPCNPNRF